MRIRNLKKVNHVYLIYYEALLFQVQNFHIMVSQHRTRHYLHSTYYSYNS